MRQRIKIYLGQIEGTTPIQVSKSSCEIAEILLACKKQQVLVQIAKCREKKCYYITWTQNKVVLPSNFQLRLPNEKDVVYSYERIDPGNWTAMNTHFFERRPTAKRRFTNKKMINPHLSGQCAMAYWAVREPYANSFPSRNKTTLPCFLR